MLSSGVHGRDDSILVDLGSDEHVATAPFERTRVCTAGVAWRFSTAKADFVVSLLVTTCCHLADVCAEVSVSISR